MVAGPAVDFARFDAVWRDAAAARESEDAVWPTDEIALAEAAWRVRSGRPVRVLGWTGVIVLCAGVVALARKPPSRDAMVAWGTMGMVTPAARIPETPKPPATARAEELTCDVAAASTSTSTSTSTSASADARGGDVAVPGTRAPDAGAPRERSRTAAPRFARPAQPPRTRVPAVPRAVTDDPYADTPTEAPSANKPPVVEPSEL